MSFVVDKLRELEQEYRYRCIQTPADSSMYEVLDELRTFSLRLANILEEAEKKEVTRDAAETGERSS